MLFPIKINCQAFADSSFEIKNLDCPKFYLWIDINILYREFKRMVEYMEYVTSSDEIISIDEEEIYSAKFLDIISNYLNIEKRPYNSAPFFSYLEYMLRDLRRFIIDEKPISPWIYGIKNIDNYKPKLILNEVKPLFEELGFTFKINYNKIERTKIMKKYY